MRAQQLTTILLLAAAGLVFAMTPGEAQAPPAKKKQPAAANAPATRLTVRRRSFLDPGTETKTNAEHFRDYAFPPGDHNPSNDPNDFRVNFTRMPFPSCFDLPGYCR
jgi:hypothetical protein